MTGEKTINYPDKQSQVGIPLGEKNHQLTSHSHRFVIPLAKSAKILNPIPLTM